MALFSYWHLPVQSDACLLEELKVLVIFCPVSPTREHRRGSGGGVLLCLAVD